MEDNELLERLSTAERTLPTKLISNKYNGLKVVGLVADHGACGHYRVINPLHMLKLHGAQVEYSTTQSLQNFLEADIILAPRQHGYDSYEMLRLLEWEGKIVIFEIDDDLHTVLETSPAHTVYYKGAETLTWLEKFMAESHGMTVTTEELKATYDRFNGNTEVVGNFIDFSFRDWKVDVTWDANGDPTLTPQPIIKPPHWEGKVVIGWSGGSSHFSDLQNLFPQIGKVLEKYPNTHFAYYGPPDIFNYLNKDNILPYGRHEQVNPRHFMDHPTGLFGIDIGLAPIHSCAFNLSKSNLKILEGMAAGQAMVASNVAPYSKFSRKHPDSTVIVGKGSGNYSSWFEAIEKLVLDNDLRNSMKEKGRELIIDQYSLEKNYHRWPLAWNEIIKRANAGQVGPNEKSRGKVWRCIDRNDFCPCNSGKKYKNCCVSSHG